MEDTLEENEWIIIIENLKDKEEKENDSVYFIILIAFFILKYLLIYFIYSL